MSRKHRVILAACAALVWLPLAGSVSAQSNSKEIMERPAAELVALVKDPNATVFEKAKACQRLAVIGTAEHVPALAALLADENLNLYGRFALEAIPDPAVDEALRAAAGKLQGRQLVGVINSIGVRRDAQALALLAGLAGHGDRAVASAAAHAIGSLGTVEAAAWLTEALSKDSPVKRCLGDGALACAEGLATAGKQAEAVALYGAVAQADVPQYLQIGALAGQFRLQKTAAKDLLLAQLRSADEAHFQLGLSVARWMPGADVTAALADELEKLPPERQALLLRALGDRQEAVPMPLVVAATKSSSPAVRDAAIAVLAKLGDAAAVGTLLDAALGDGPAAAIEFWKDGKYVFATSQTQQVNVELAGLAEPLPLDEDWQVRFAPGWGAPESIRFARLTAWDTHENPDIKYFSGTATYCKTLELPEPQAQSLLRLQLGPVGCIARVRLNGRDQGLVWTDPWTIDLTGAARAGKNELEIDVANVWQNRLIGDAGLPEEQRRTKTNVILEQGERTRRYRCSSVNTIDALTPSGLIGPVRLEFGQLRKVPLDDKTAPAAH